MATFYFNGAVDINWEELGNWWMDSDHSVPASGLPTNSDDVVITFTSCDPAGSRTVNNLTLDWATLEDNEYIGSTYSTLTINGVGTFYNSTIWISIIPVYGNCVFNGTGGPAGGGVVFGNAVFNDYTINGCGVMGNAVFNDYSGVDNSCYVGGNATFNDHSRLFEGNVSGSATFNHNSWNQGKVSGDATFNDSTFNGAGYGGVVMGTATFRGSSYNSAVGYLGGEGSRDGVQIYTDRTPYPIPRGINGSSILGVI